MIEELIARLEAAEYGSFLLDTDIVRYANPQATRLSVAPPYTTSIDAALTLLPAGWGFMSLGADPYEEDAFCVTVYDRSKWNRHREWPEGSITTGYSLASPVIAICIAALRAMQNNPVLSAKSV